MLLLVGEGEQEQEGRQFAKELGIDKQVIFAGAHRDVERYYQAMDVFLFPSRYEGFGMAMIEAQTGGLSCVASDVVPRETNVDGRAVFLPLEGKDDVWADKVIEAPARDTSAYQKICRLYGAAHAAEIIEKIYI